MTTLPDTDPATAARRLLALLAPTDIIGRPLLPVDPAPFASYLGLWILTASSPRDGLGVIASRDAGTIALLSPNIGPSQRRALVAVALGVVVSWLEATQLRPAFELDLATLLSDPDHSAFIFASHLLVPDCALIAFADDQPLDLSRRLDVPLGLVLARL